MRILTVVGARPQFIKAAALSHAVAHRQAEGFAISEVLVHTGQHYDARMSDVFFDELGIPAPAHHLGVGSAQHGEQTGEMLKRLEPVVLSEKPDCMLVYGDTNSTLAAALVASKLCIPLAHVEAGLRSFNRAMPEEINRILTDHVSDWLFCPSGVALDNLANEGIRRGVHVVGDVMYDVQRLTMARLGGTNPVAAGLGLEDGGYVLVTIHRASNTDDPARFAALTAMVASIGSSVPVIWPVHPRVRSYLADWSAPGVHLTEPAGYADMIALEHGATAVATDSGGVQKEAYWAGVPCLTLRNETEWTETVDQGWNMLVGDRLEEVPALVSALDVVRGLDRPPVYGDGDAANRIIALLSADPG